MCAARWNASPYTKGWIAMSDVRVAPWRISRDAPVDGYSESLFALGNGYLGVRGFSLQEPKRRACDHGIFRAGLFEPIRPGITDMVQLPDVLGLRVVGEEPRAVFQELDMRAGVLTHRWRGKAVEVATSRMVSMADTQLICIRMRITALEKTYVRVQNAVDAEVRNLPVHDDQTVEETETVRLLKAAEQTEGMLRMRTAHTGREVCFRISCMGPLEAGLAAGETLALEKRVRVLMDGEAAHPDEADPWAAHQSAWDALWRDCDIRLDADSRIQGAVRYNVFQLLCSNAAETADVSIGARGLTHGRYKGNAFWDTDIFMLPFFCWHRPQAAKNLVRYRLNRLDAARALAAQQNLKGARYPWMCAADGTEQCESWDIGLCETHVTAGVAYAAHRCAEITGDGALEGQSAEMYLETARYWLSRFTWEPGRRQYSSFFVKGPDEYCGAAVNNTYTNYMARANVRLALAHAQMEEEERKRLAHFARNITLLYDPKRDLYLQDELFERLEPMPPVRREGEPLYKTVCFDRMQRYRALKQADLVQLMALFPNDFTPAQKRAVWDAYEPLTVHDSSLSFGTHALLAFRLGLREKAWSYFERSLLFDLEDVLGNTAREGVHMAALGASWQALVYGALGLWSEEGRLTAEPCLPEQIKGISLAAYHRGRRLRIVTDGGETSIAEEA